MMLLSSTDLLIFREEEAPNRLESQCFELCSEKREDKREFYLLDIPKT